MTVTTMTNAAEGAGPIVRSPLHDSIQADVGRTDQLVDLRGPAALRHEHFYTTDPETAQRFFASAYTPGWQLSGLVRSSAITHRRAEAEVISLDELLIEGWVGCEIRPTDSVVVIQPRTGSLTVGGEPLTSMDAPVLAADGMPCLLRANAARFDVVSIDTKLLRKVAAERQVPVPPQLQFLSSHPRSRTVVGTWHRALDYVIASFGFADTAHRPLMVAAAGQLLAAALLECFPSNVTAGQDLLGNPAVPQSFKDAVSFIHHHAGHGIGVNDVAAAVRLTPRAVQYLFRQQADATPMEYLRRVRLHRTHLELMSGDRSTTTVTSIAQRWGFAHTGRFAVLYREVYGQSPHTTLRQ